MNSRTKPSEANRSGKAGRYFIVLNSDSEYELSLGTCGRERDTVTPKSDSRVQTVFEVIDGPPSVLHRLRGAVNTERAQHRLLGEEPVLAGVHDRADDIAGKDIDHHVCIVVGALDRASELGDVSGTHLPRGGRDKLGDLPRRMRGPPASLPHLSIFGQDPIRGGDRAHVLAAFEEDDDIIGRPACPNDGVLLRDVPGGARCPLCGFEEHYPAVTRPEIGGENMIDFHGRARS